MDFVHDQLEDAHNMRRLNIIDDFNREAGALKCSSHNLRSV